MRYRLLETIRQYAAQELLQVGRRGRGRARSGTGTPGTTCASPRRRRRRSTGPGQGHWLRRLDAEWENLRAAFSHLAADGRTDDVLRLGVWLQRFAMSRGHAEVLTWLPARGGSGRP